MTMQEFMSLPEAERKALWHGLWNAPVGRSSADVKATVLAVAATVDVSSNCDGKAKDQS